MASSAAGKPSPPPPGGWLSDLISGASRILAAVLGPESSASDGTSSSSPESSQSPLPPRRTRRTPADQGHGAHFAYDNYQFNKSGKEIVLKDNGDGSLGMVSDMDPKDAAAQLLMQETFSRSECDALMKIIQERVVDSGPSVVEPDVVLPIAWLPSSDEHPVAYSSPSPKNSASQTSGVPLFGNAGEKRGLKTSSTTVEDPCNLKDLSGDQRRHVVGRSSSYKADTFKEPRRVRPKLNKSNISGKLSDDLCYHEIFSNPSIHDAGELRVPGEYKDIPLLGTDNLTFSNMASQSETARTVQHLARSSRQDQMKRRGSAKFYPHSNRDLTKAEVEPFVEYDPVEPEMMHLGQKNDERTLSNESCSASKIIFQEDIEAATSSSVRLQGENRSRDCTKGLKLQCSIPTKRRSPANSSGGPSKRHKIGSWNGSPQQSNPTSVGQERSHSQGRRAVGRSRNTERKVKPPRRLQL
ncbi:hypothetical protein EJB05_24578, partial [Eragrostis curvula]